MYLKKVTLVLIFSMMASFAVRGIGTLHPLIFYQFSAVKVAILVNSFFILNHLLFWLVLYQEYISLQKPALKAPCLFAIAGSVAVSMVYLKKFPLVFGMTPLYPPMLASPYFDAIIPVLAAVAHLVFFIFLNNALEPMEKVILRKPVVSIICGISIYLGLHLAVLLNFLATRQFAWLEHMPWPVAAGTVPLIFLAMCLMVFFYYRFYRFLAVYTK